jgi:hypothetical protein
MTENVIFLSSYYIYSDIYMALGVGWNSIFVTGQGSIARLSGSAGSGWSVECEIMIYTINYGKD